MTRIVLDATRTSVVTASSGPELKPGMMTNLTVRIASPPDIPEDRPLKFQAVQQDRTADRLTLAVSVDNARLRKLPRALREQLREAAFNSLVCKVYGEAHRDTVIAKLAAERARFVDGGDTVILPQRFA